MAEGEYTREQELLKKIRDEFCGGVSARLAEVLGKDATYVNRLFYPIGKKGRKGIGLEIMRAVSEKFRLPAGFWEGADVIAAERKKGDVFHEVSDQEWAMLQNYRKLLDKDRAALDKQIADAAAERQAEMDELFARYGVRASVERANARRDDESHASVEPTAAIRQQNLDFDEPGSKE